MNTPSEAVGVRQAVTNLLDDGHELRTPLSTICLWPRMLASGKVRLEEARYPELMSSTPLV